jgi:alkylhydroperoxidase/carboxymuconolactone decarboxylase family protein YurZ
MGEDGGAIDPVELMRKYTEERGDIFPEFHYMAQHRPRTVHYIHRTAGYILRNKNQETPDQELSLVMRELIATCILSSKGDERFAANHVRRLYRLGITNAVILEAGEGMAPVFGHSSISHVAQSILLANDPDYPFGEMPETGEPAELTPFPEMTLGSDEAPQGSALMDDPDWQYASRIDPELVQRTAEFVDHCLGTKRVEPNVLPVCARLLVAIAALCVRGELEIMADYIRRAYQAGANRRKVLEAISCAHNMTGAVSVQMGLKAMQLAEDAAPQ